MRLRLAVFVVVVGALASHAAPAAAQEVVSATCPGPPTSNRAFGPVVGAGNNRFAQTFTVQHTGTLTTVTLHVYNSTGTPGDFRIQILGVDGLGVPVSNPLSSQTIDDASVPTMGPEAGFITAHPQPVLNVTAGQQFALAASRPGSNTSGIRTVEMDPCPGDLFAGGPAPDPLGPEGSNHEMPFSAFVTLPPTPQPPPVTTTQPAAKPNKCKRKNKGKPRGAAAKKKKCKKRKKRR